MTPSVEARADHGNPLPICIRNREWLVQRYRVDAMIALRFLGGDAPMRSEEKEEDAKVVKHVRECPKCREWVHEIVPKELFRRQSRLVRYCCAGMFTAVEEPRSVSVSFELYRGEDPCWKIDDQRAFISYCPWCGKKLPERPFIPEE